jgi:hypothetical protein
MTELGGPLPTARGVIAQCNGCAWSLYGCLRDNSCDDLLTTQPTNLSRSASDARLQRVDDRFARVADTVFRDDLGSDSSGGGQPYDSACSCPVGQHAHASTVNVYVSDSSTSLPTGVQCYPDDPTAPEDVTGEASILAGAAITFGRAGHMDVTNATATDTDEDSSGGVVE